MLNINKGSGEINKMWEIQGFRLEALYNSTIP
jgi:hypothetical protein